MAEAILNQAHFQDPNAARAHLEALRWPEGAVCPHCGVVGNSTQLHGAAHRPGLWKCNDCRAQFSVTVGTVFEDSKVPLHKWLQAVHWMCASKKGISAKQLERMLGVSYKTAWFMSHRIREAMRSEPTWQMGGNGTSGIVEADETYWGKTEGVDKPRRGLEDKMKLISLVERHGEKRTFHVANVTAETARAVLTSQVHKDAHLMTDEALIYKKTGRMFKEHSTVNHAGKEYARGRVTTNTIESSFAILKRGLVGTFHSVSERHLQRYADEFDFRWNYRSSMGYDDTHRAAIALKGIEGKRLTYRG
ncbi:MAG: IS1595 family transposase [Pseudomonadota bacterium]